MTAPTGPCLQAGFSPGRDAGPGFFSWRIIITYSSIERIKSKVIISFMFSFWIVLIFIVLFPTTFLINDDINLLNWIREGYDVPFMSILMGTMQPGIQADVNTYLHGQGLKPQADASILGDTTYGKISVDKSIYCCHPGRCSTICRLWVGDDRKFLTSTRPDDIGSTLVFRYLVDIFGKFNGRAGSFR